MKINKKKLKDKYKSDLVKVMDVINELDHYGITSGGGPSDEFSMEAAQIIAVFRKTNDWLELRNEIYNIFKTAFSGDGGNIYAYDEAAKKIFDILKNNKS